MTLLALAGCAKAPPPPPVQPAPAPAASETPLKRTATVTWYEDDSPIIGCPLTETWIEVPERWRSDLRQISAAEVVVPPTDHRRGAVLIRSADHPLTTREALDDLGRLFELMDVSVPKLLQNLPDYSTEEPLPDIEYIDANMTPIEIEPGPPGSNPIVVGYRLVGRNDATCRLATAAPKSDPITLSLSMFLATAHTPIDPFSRAFIFPSKTTEPPPATCKGWPVWMFPSCRPAVLPPTRAGTRR